MFDTATLLLLIVSSAFGQSSIIYNQAQTLSTGWTSSGTGVAGFQSYDNFVLTDPAQLTGVDWQGYYRDSVTPTNNPVSPNTQRWKITIYSDAGVPASPLATQTFFPVEVQATFLGYATFVGNVVPVYDYHADLHSPISLSNNQTYWLSVFSSATSTNPLWAWTSGFGADGLTVQNQLPSGSYAFRPDDRTFSLEGIVPEPAAASLGYTAAAILFLRRRR